MTPLAGLICAVIAAFLLRDSRRAVLGVLPAWLAVLAFQTWAIGAGHGVSPPNTVSQPSYWVVQLLIFALTFGVATQLGALLPARVSVGATPDGIRRQYVRTIGFSTGSCAVIIYLTFGIFRSVFDPGSVTHHSAQGSPPIAGMVGMLLLVVGCVALAVMRLTRRRSLAQSAPAIS